MAIRASLSKATWQEKFFPKDRVDNDSGRPQESQEFKSSWSVGCSAVAEPLPNKSLRAWVALAPACSNLFAPWLFGLVPEPSPSFGKFLAVYLQIFADRRKMCRKQTCTAMFRCCIVHSRCRMHVLLNVTYALSPRSQSKG